MAAEEGSNGWAWQTGHPETEPSASCLGILTTQNSLNVHIQQPSKTCKTEDQQQVRWHHEASQMNMLSKERGHGVLHPLLALEVYPPLSGFASACGARRRRCQRLTASRKVVNKNLLMAGANSMFGFFGFVSGPCKAPRAPS